MADLTNQNDGTTVQQGYIYIMGIEWNIGDI